MKLSKATQNKLVQQLIAQRDAMEHAMLTGIPTPDGYGCVWYPPGKDGIPICEVISGTKKATRE